MPGWLVKIIQALAIPVLNWAGGLIRDWIESARIKREAIKKDKKQKKRESLTRQLEIAKAENNEAKIRELSIALVLLDTND